MLQNVLYLGINTIFTAIEPKQNTALNLSEMVDIFLPFNFVLATLTVDTMREMLSFITTYKMEITF